LAAGIGTDRAARSSTSDADATFEISESRVASNDVVPHSPTGAGAVNYDAVACSRNPFLTRGWKGSDAVVASVTGADAGQPAVKTAVPLALVPIRFL
jgi:hypothetical protein